MPNLADASDQRALMNIIYQKDSNSRLNNIGSKSQLQQIQQSVSFLGNHQFDFQRPSQMNQPSTQGSQYLQDATATSHMHNQIAAGPHPKNMELARSFDRLKGHLAPVINQQNNMINNNTSGRMKEMVGLEASASRLSKKQASIEKSISRSQLTHHVANNQLSSSQKRQKTNKINDLITAIDNSESATAIKSMASIGQRPNANDQNAAKPNPRGQNQYFMPKNSHILQPVARNTIGRKQQRESSLKRNFMAVDPNCTAAIDVNDSTENYNTGSNFQSPFQSDDSKRQQYMANNMYVAPPGSGNVNVDSSMRVAGPNSINNAYQAQPQHPYPLSEKLRTNKQVKRSFIQDAQAVAAVTGGAPGKAIWDASGYHSAYRQQPNNHYLNSASQTNNGHFGGTHRRSHSKKFKRGNRVADEQNQQRPHFYQFTKYQNLDLSHGSDSKSIQDLKNHNVPIKTEASSNNVARYMPLGNHKSKNSIGFSDVLAPLDVAQDDEKKKESVVDTLTANAANSQAIGLPNHKLPMYQTAKNNVFKNILNKKYFNNQEQPNLTNYATTLVNNNTVYDPNASQKLPTSLNRSNEPQSKLSQLRAKKVDIQQQSSLPRNHYMQYAFPAGMQSTSSKTGSLAAAHRSQPAAHWSHKGDQRYLTSNNFQAILGGATGAGSGANQPNKSAPGGIDQSNNVSPFQTLPRHRRNQATNSRQFEKSPGEDAGLAGTTHYSVHPNFQLGHQYSILFDKTAGLRSQKRSPEMRGAIGGATLDKDGSMGPSKPEEKMMYAFGATQFGQLGVGYTTEKEMRLPVRVTMPVKFSKISLGAGHAIALSKSQKVYCWGLNLLGQLGLGSTEPSWQPTLIPAFRDNCVVDVAAGAGHSFAVDKQGLVYSWGASAHFQTGIVVKPAGGAGQNTHQYILTPQPVDGINKKKQRIIQISCGLKHTAVITYCMKSQMNMLICFGANQYGQCGNGEHGQGKLKTNFETNFLLQGKSITMVECAGAHTIIKSINNDLFSFGLNDKGQLGLGVVGKFSSIPHKIQRFTSFQIVKIACSDESSSVLTSNGDFYVWGRNSDGMFDTDQRMRFLRDAPIARPTLLSGQRIENMALGPKALVLQKNNGQIEIQGSLFLSQPPQPKTETQASLSPPKIVEQASKENLNHTEQTNEAQSQEKKKQQQPESEEQNALVTVKQVEPAQNNSEQLSPKVENNKADEPIILQAEGKEASSFVNDPEQVDQQRTTFESKPKRSICKSPFGSIFNQSMYDGAQLEKYDAICKFFDDKIVKDVFCGRGMVLVIASLKPKLQTPRKLPEKQDTPKKLPIKIPTPKRPSPPREPTPSPKQQTPPQEPPPAEEEVPPTPPRSSPPRRSPSPVTQRITKTRDDYLRERTKWRPVPTQRRAPLSRQPSPPSPPKEPEPPVVDEHEERMKKLEEETKKAEEARRRKMLLRMQRQKEREEQRKMMEMEMRQTMQNKRQHIKQETVQLQLQLQRIKSINKQAALENSIPSTPSPPPRERTEPPKMKRTGGGYVQPTAIHQNARQQPSYDTHGPQNRSITAKRAQTCDSTIRSDKRQKAKPGQKQL